MDRITSRQNPLVREFRSLASPSGDAAHRRGTGRMLLDGAHLVEEAIASGVRIDVVAVDGDLAGTPLWTLASRTASLGARLVEVTSAVLSAMSPVKQPSGIVAVARRTSHSLSAALDRPPQLALVLSGVQDPGNLGSIVRVADACGATGIVTCDGTADPFGWKALRGSMGSAFRIPIAVRQSFEATAEIARQRGIRLYAAVPRGGTPLPSCDLRSSSAVMLGAEGAGLPDSVLELSDDRLTIPMRPDVESVNVATAAALIVYEAQRQRSDLQS